MGKRAREWNNLIMVGDRMDHKSNMDELKARRERGAGGEGWAGYSEFMLASWEPASQFKGHPRYFYYFCFLISPSPPSICILKLGALGYATLVSFACWREVSPFFKKKNLDL